MPEPGSGEIRTSIKPGIVTPSSTTPIVGAFNPEPAPSTIVGAFHLETPAERLAKERDTRKRAEELVTQDKIKSS